MASTVWKLFLVLSMAGKHSSFLLPTSDPSIGCPLSIPRDSNLKIYAGFCYQFILHEQRFYWHEARNDCLTRGGELVIVDSNGIQHFILNVLNKVHFIGSGIWLGLAEDGLQHRWKWVNGANVTYSNWDLGYVGDDYYQECAHMKATDGHWQATPCKLAEFHMAYVCQYKFQPDPFVTPIPSTLSTSSTRYSALNCSFETGMCDFVQSVTDDFDWTLTNISTPTKGTGPDRDHTTGTGYYIYMETSIPRHEGERAVIISGLQKPTDTKGNCLSFYYYMFGANVNRLNVYLHMSAATDKTMIWTRINTQGNAWKLGQRTIRSSMPYQIIFEGIVGTNWQGDIALDDIAMTTDPCPPPTTCDFEADFCDWTQDPTLDADQFNWVRHRGGTPSTNTGPESDHTTQTQYGYYMYIEASAPRRQGDIARIVSPVYSGHQSCLTFWYHMWGANTGTLSVYSIWTGNISTFSPNQLKNPVWTRTGQQGNRWIYAMIQLTSLMTTKSYNVIFEGVVGNGYRGDIAIDDVNILPGKCPPPGNCNFELDTCGFTNTHGSGDNLDWMRSTGSSLVRGTGPYVDHTTNSDRGFYMFIQAEGKNNGQRAWFYSPFFSPTPATCLSFWYNMNGTDTGTLRIYQAMPGNTSILWQKSGNQGNIWHNQKIAVTSSAIWQISIDGQVGNGIYGDIAIDDFTFTKGACTNASQPVSSTISPISSSHHYHTTKATRHTVATTAPASTQFG